MGLDRCGTSRPRTRRRRSSIASSAKRARVDHSLLSRLSVYLDTRDPLMLGASDRVIAEALPAHLDGAMAARSAPWAEKRHEAT